MNHLTHVFLCSSLIPDSRCPKTASIMSSLLGRRNVSLLEFLSKLLVLVDYLLVCRYQYLDALLLKSEILLRKFWQIYESFLVHILLVGFETDRAAVGIVKRDFRLLL